MYVDRGSTAATFADMNDTHATAPGRVGGRNEDDERVEFLWRELERMAKARHLGRVDAAELPLLRELAGTTEAEALLEHVESAIARLGPRKSTAAGYLLGNTSERWNRTYKARSTDAAAELAVGSYHTFRDRKTGDGLSPHDRLLRDVARCLLEAADEPTTTPDHSDLDIDIDLRDERPPSESDWTGRSTRRARAVIALTLLVAAAAAVGAFAVRSANAGQDNPLPVLGTVVDGCDLAVAASTTPSATPQRLETMMLDAFDAEGGVEVLGCPEFGMVRFGDVWLQRFLGSNDRPTGYLVANLIDDTAFWAESGVVDEYQSVLNGRLPTEGGLPVRYELLDGRAALWLSKGGVVLGHAPGGPAFWIPVEALEPWQAGGGVDGDLGLPMTDVRYIKGRPRQDFERGLITEGEPFQAVVDLATDDDLSRYRSRLGTFGEGIIRSVDGTAWWLDAEGRRHWIPSAEVWHCLGGDAVVIDQEAPGWFIGSFSPEENAACR